MLRLEVAVCLICTKKYRDSSGLTFYWILDQLQFTNHSTVPSLISHRVFETDIFLFSCFLWLLQFWFQHTSFKCTLITTKNTVAIYQWSLRYGDSVTTTDKLGYRNKWKYYERRNTSDYWFVNSSAHVKFH